MVVLSFNFTLPADNSTTGATAVSFALFPSTTIFVKLRFESACDTSNIAFLKPDFLFIVYALPV